MGTTAAVVIAAGAAILALAFAALATARARSRSDRRLNLTLGRIGDSMEVLSKSMLAVVEGAAAGQGPGLDLGLSLDLGDVLQETARAAAALVGADGAGVAVNRERGEPATATFGIGVAAPTQAGLEPPDASAWNAVTVQWLPDPAAGDDTVRSALAVPCCMTAPVSAPSPSTRARRGRSPRNRRRSSRRWRSTQCPRSSTPACTRRRWSSCGRTP